MAWLRRGQRTVAAALMAALAAACGGGGPRPAGSDASVGAHVAVVHPTVVAYFVIPNGAVDTLPDLAVEADDWNVAMASLRDSLTASGIDLAMVTDSTVRITGGGRPDTTLALGSFRSAGYVFVRPGGAPCVRRGGMDADSVKAAARAFAADGRCT